jgi:hypothetical protein
MTLPCVMMNKNNTATSSRRRRLHQTGPQQIDCYFLFQPMASWLRLWARLSCRVVSCRVVYFPTSIFLILIPNINFPKLKTITQPYKMDPTTKLQRIHYIFISIFLLVIHTALLIHFCSLNFLFLSPIWLFLLVHRDGYPYYHIY